jgi:N6-adenosine-specific RNA methylase IME4
MRCSYAPGRLENQPARRNDAPTCRLPQTYVDARRALASATMDQAKSFRDKSMAMEVYAFQAKDAELMGLSVDIKKRSERRIGQLMAELREGGKLAKGTRGEGRPKKAGQQRTRLKDTITLADQGLDKHLADRARKAAAMTEQAFEAALERAKALALAAVEGAGAVVREARVELHQEKKARRAERERELGGKQAALPAKKYGVIVADPEWRFEVYSELGLTNSSAANHYPTSALETIKQRDVASIAADDCVLFLWATAPMLPQALEVMAAWGFGYVSQQVWIKPRAGTGYWFRNRHELLLVGKRGKVPAPAPGEQADSIIEAPLGRHSEKPVAVMKMIERLFPSLPKIELNSREPRAGWDAWGNEIGPQTFAPEVTEATK